MCFAISVTIRGEIVSWLPGSRSASPLNLSTIRLYLGCPATDSRLDMKNCLRLRRDARRSQEIAHLGPPIRDSGAWAERGSNKGHEGKIREDFQLPPFIELLKTFVPFV